MYINVNTYVPYTYSSSIRFRFLKENKFVLIPNPCSHSPPLESGTEKKGTIIVIPHILSHY
jgi:hypothetical protein